MHLTSRTVRLLPVRPTVDGWGGISAIAIETPWLLREIIAVRLKGTKTWRGVAESDPPPPPRPTSPADGIPAERNAAPR